jgi:hypothetical protein
MLGCAVTLLSLPLELLRQIPVDRSEVNSAGGFGPPALFHRPCTVIVGIVRHDGTTTAIHVRSVVSNKFVTDAELPSIERGGTTSRLK